ncbi:hypothetical protein A3F66_00640 [candidate division TM6 bacterium RIFCSPHIGHO2_12_FULL_32_22]|nr:MAG: hypothetical protein A3F66_00640 [candidate division TM6 bacterium RIFCSPHIGHO2_12_FULL_32_22]
MCEQIHTVAVIIAAIGALNWGLVGLFNFNVVEQLTGLLGSKDLLARIVYILVGLAGLYVAIDVFFPCALFK